MSAALAAHADKMHRKIGRRRQAGPLLFALLAITVTEARADVFGVDDRQPVPTRLTDVARGVGLLSNVRTLSICSMFCVAPSVVATAAHCLVPAPGGDAGRARFVDVRVSVAPFGPRETSTIAGASIGAASQHVTTGDRADGAGSDPADDWALVRTAQPICTGRMLRLADVSGDDIVAAAASGRLFHLAFHSDRGLAAPTFAAACTLVPAPATDDTSKLLLHSCDTGGAASGSPLLIETANGPRVAAMNTGVYGQRRVLVRDATVVSRSDAAAVANVAIGLVPLQQRLAVFATAGILDDVGDVKRLQQALKKGGWFASAVSGAHTRALTAAIERYEAASALSVTGLATRALLQRLETPSP